MIIESARMKITSQVRIETDQTFNSPFKFIHPFG